MFLGMDGIVTAVLLMITYIINQSILHLCSISSHSVRQRGRCGIVCYRLLWRSNREIGFKVNS